MASRIPTKPPPYVIPIATYHPKFCSMYLPSYNNYQLDQKGLRNANLERKATTYSLCHDAILFIHNICTTRPAATRGASSSYKNDWS